MATFNDLNNANNAAEIAKKKNQPQSQQPEAQSVSNPQQDAKSKAIGSLFKTQPSQANSMQGLVSNARELFENKTESRGPIKGYERPNLLSQLGGFKNPSAEPAMQDKFGGLRDILNKQPQPVGRQSLQQAMQNQAPAANLQQGMQQAQQAAIQAMRNQQLQQPAQAAQPQQQSQPMGPSQQEAQMRQQLMGNQPQQAGQDNSQIDSQIAALQQQIEQLKSQRK